MKDENGVVVPQVIVQVYRLKNIYESERWSRQHGKMLHKRKYELMGSITNSEAELVLRAMFRRTPERVLTGLEFSHDGRFCWIYWQTER